MRYVVDASVAITWYVDAARHTRARALEFALALDHPDYDGLYLAAAEAADGVVVTDDRRFHAAAVAGGAGDRIALLEALAG